LTHAWIRISASGPDYGEEWEESIVAPPLTIHGIANELHFHVRRYLQAGYSWRIIVVFLFFNLVQRLLYAYGFFIGCYPRKKKFG